MRALLPVVASLILAAGCLSSESPGPAETRDAAPPPSSGRPAQASSTPGNQSGSSPSNTSEEKPQKIASGTILVAGPWTRAYRSLAVQGYPGYDGFFFKSPSPGSRVTTRSRDNSGLGYDLDLNFHDAAGTWLGAACQTSARDEVCKVPERASRGEVTANVAVNVLVDVYYLPANSTLDP